MMAILMSSDKNGEGLNELKGYSPWFVAGQGYYRWRAPTKLVEFSCAIFWVCQRKLNPGKHNKDGKRCLQMLRPATGREVSSIGLAFYEVLIKGPLGNQVHLNKKRVECQGYGQRVNISAKDVRHRRNGGTQCHLLDQSLTVLTFGLMPETSECLFSERSSFEVFAEQRKGKGRRWEAGTAGGRQKELGRASDFQNQKGLTFHFIILYYLMSSSPQPVFPFFNYYPFLFFPPWPLHSQSPPQNPFFLSKTRETFQSQPQEPIEKTQEPQKELSPPSRKPAEKNRFKRRREREQDYSRKHQKKDRNLPSNIFKILANYVYNNSKMADHLRTLTPASVEADPNRLLEKFKELVKVNQSYIRPAIIQSLCSGGELSREESVVFRIFVRKFLLEEFPVIIVQQPKLRKSQKTAYLKLARVLQKQLSDCFYK